MCGIAGLIADSQQVVEQALAAMNAAQFHRGPDDSGTSFLPFGSNRLLGFAHRLLSPNEAGPFIATGLMEKNLDRKGLAGWLAYGAMQHPAKILEHIRSFPPGSYQFFDSAACGQSSPFRFWSYPSRRTDIDEQR